MLAIQALAARLPKAHLGLKSSPASLRPSTSTPRPITALYPQNSSIVGQQTRSFHLSSVPAAVPKKKQSYSRVRVRTHSQNWQIKLSDWRHHHACRHCGKQVLRHNVCSHCGWYKGIPIYLRAIQRQEHKLTRAALRQQLEEKTQASTSP